MQNQSTFENLNPVRVDALDEILGKPFKILDDGFIRVIDYMGDDSAIVQAARVSYGKGTKKVREDRTLIRYLLRHRHTSPFEMCELKLHIRIPMDCWRQWIRHRTASVNEYSTRYSMAIDAAQTTTPDEWRLQAETNRQGSEGLMDSTQGNTLSKEELELQSFARSIYTKRIELGVAREQARKDLPLSTYTEAYWKIDLHNLLHFLELRMERHAQLEIRKYASVIGQEIVKRWCPLTWEAFQDYWLNAVSFSPMEQQLLQLLSSEDLQKTLDKVKELGWLKTNEDGSLKLHFERLEFEQKLEHMGLQIPWQD
ncbi:FAD-dependent thymidylate synthase [candidate division KSB1 bacterium]|nr:FAD-dependent thymidylate synthase [candidate division KSB1 bacterium]